MDNHLTPNKIQRLMYIAQDKSYNNTPQISTQANQAHQSKSTVNYESSSGILDLERVEAFGESGFGNESLSKYSTFNPGELTGRSTGADDFTKPMPLARHSLALDCLTHKLDKQTDEVNDLMRHSICNTTGYSFHSKRDLTADEASLVIREAPIPIQPSTQTPFADITQSNTSNVSVGAYFQNRCPEFGQILGKTDSPDRSAFTMPSITEVVAAPTPADPKPPPTPQTYVIDESLDCVPVRQSRLENPQNLTHNAAQTKNQERQTFRHPANVFTNDAYNKTGHNYSSMSRVPEVYNMPMSLNPVASSSFASHKGMPPTKPTNLFLKTLNSSLVMMTEETGGDSACPTENSLSISKIADYLGKESNLSITGMLKHNKKPPLKKQPLTELHMNLQESKQTEPMQVTNLRDTRNMDTASSAGAATVISLDKLKISQEKQDPKMVVTSASEVEFKDKKRSTRSKSPSSKSHSTLSTVQEKISFRSGDSPLHTQGEVNSTHIPSPNIEYRELDKSVDWREVLQQKRLKQLGLAKEQWADISATPANGYVGVSCTVNFTMTALTDSWLTAKLQFDDLPNDGRDLTVELPRQPFLLSPGLSEQFTINISSNVEMHTTLPYTTLLKDASVDEEIEQKGSLDVHIKMPVIQAMSCDGVNKVTFPPVQEKNSYLKSFVIISDCPVDLKLDLSVVEGDSAFTIKSVQEIKKSDVNKVLMGERQESVEEVQGKAKSKGMNKQLCRLSSGNAIKVTIKFTAPKLSELQIEESVVTFNGALNVNVIGVNTVLRQVELIGYVGTVSLVVNMPGDKLHLTSDATIISVCNTGSIPGVWVAMESAGAFKVAPSRFELRPGVTKKLSLCYTGPEDTICEGTLAFEELSSGAVTTVQIYGGSDKPKQFPIRTNHAVMSFVRAGRKELSLKNSTNKKIYIRCHIMGEGFSIDLPGMEARGIYCLSFGPGECRPLPILFNPPSNAPYAANLYLAYEKNNDLTRNVRLYGCCSGDSMRWSGLVTYGETALVRAASRAPVTLELYNKRSTPAFVCADVHFNVQYTSVSSTAQLLGSHTVVGGRKKHALTLAVDWARVERRARDAATAALATVTVLTGAETTRRRILRVLRDKSTGAVDDSLLDDNLKVLTKQFAGEDPNMDNLLKDFNETKVSLSELIGGLHELTAQIVLPQDFADENTIIITDDTVVEHHTLCD